MGSVSGAVPVQVSTIASTVTTLGATTSSVDAGANVTFTVTVTGMAPTGTVTFTDGATTLGTVGLNSGMANFTTNFARAGAKTITASYSGDATHAPSAATLALTVRVPVGQLLPVLQLLLD
jgi:hypothetical protein